MYDRRWKGWRFNTGDCLIEVTTWAGLTVLSPFLKLARCMSIDHVSTNQGFRHVEIGETNPTTISPIFLLKGSQWFQGW